MYYFYFSNSRNITSPQSTNYSSIFRLEITETGKAVNILGKSFANIKTDLNTGQGLFYSIFGGNKFSKNDVKLLEQHVSLIKNGVAPNIAWNQTLSGASTAARDATRNIKDNAEALTTLQSGLKTSTFGAKALSLGLAALQAAMNVVVIMAVIKGIQLLAKAIDNYKHRVENAQKALDDFNSSIEDKRNEYKEQAQLIDDVAESYDTLAEKVNTNTNFNLGLHEDEYDEFIDLNNRLAEAFPTLVKGYDEAGNAIIDFGDDCASAAEKLRELLEAEQEATNFEIAQELPEILKNTKTLVDDYQKDISKQQKYVEDLSRTKKLIDDINFNKINLFSNQEFKSSDIEQYDELRELMLKSSRDFISRLSIEEKRELGNVNLNENDFVRGDMHSFYFDYVHLPEDLKIRLQNIVKENVENLARFTNDELANAKRTLRDAEANKEFVWEDFTNNLITGMTSQVSYQQLSAVDQELARALIGGIDSSFAEEMGDDPLQFVRQNIMKSLSNMEFSDEDKMILANSIAEFTSLDISSMDVTGKEEAQMKLIETIQEIIPDEAVSANIILKLGLKTVAEETADAKDATIQKATDKYGGKYKGVLSGWMATNGVNTQSEFDVLNKLIDEYPTLNEALREYERLITKSADATQRLVTEQKKLTFSEQMSGVYSLSTGLDQLDSIMADIIDGKEFDYSSILDPEGDFKETFGDFKNEYEEFIKTVTESPRDISKCKTAFNNLATAYVNSTGVLEDLTEETKEAAILELKQMGVANAKAIVEERIATTNETRALQEKYLTETGKALLEQSWEQISAYLTEAQAGELAIQMIAALKLKQLDLQNNPIDLSTNISEILSLAKAAKVGQKEIENLTKLQWYQTRLDDLSKNGYSNSKQYAYLKSQFDELSNSISNTANTWTDVEIEFEKVDFRNGVKSQEALKDGAEEATKALEKEKKALEDLRNQYDELYDAINWFYDRQIDKIDDKIDALNKENETLEKQQENMDKILAAIESNYDAEIKLIQDKIDALQDENDEEERALALEQAKKKLLEAKSRKTLQV